MKGSIFLKLHPIPPYPDQYRHGRSRIFVHPGRQHDAPDPGDIGMGRLCPGI